MALRKRPAAAVVSSDSEGHVDDPVPTISNAVAAESSSKRARKVTTKAAAASEEEKAKKQLAENRRLKAQLKALQKQLNQQKPTSNDDPQGVEDNHSDSDRLPLESEEEDAVELNLSASIRRISTTTAKPPKPVDKPHIRRRQGTLPPDQQPHQVLGSVGGNIGADTNLDPSGSAQPAIGTVVSDDQGGPDPLQTVTSSPGPARAVPVAPTTTHDQAPTLQPAPFRGGVVPPSGARSKVEDYADDVKELLLDTVKHFSCYIYTKNTFPSDTQQDTFATDAWRAACNMHEEPVRYELSDRMKRIIWARKSNARGDASDEVRSHTAGAYGFRDGATTSNQRHNLALYTKLIKDGSFHHKTFNERTGKPEGFAGHPYISRVIRMAFFGNTRTATGFRYPEAFNPIPTEAVAFVLTVIRAHIEEWSSGHHAQIKFAESEFANTYKGLLDDLKAWVHGQEDVWLNIRKKWYQRAFLAGGGIMSESNNVRVSKSVLDSACEELEGRTGLTDSEEEGAGGNGDGQ
ncbi:hypothetical protein LXA43DRAFT_903960 [Ganoderma leucocontextum]|nr:hypothetical protein LXA43DRAFT_903960 [Ganoderma leucocontextum]